MRRKRKERRKRRPRVNQDLAVKKAQGINHSKMFLLAKLLYKYISPLNESFFYNVD